MFYCSVTQTFGDIFQTCTKVVFIDPGNVFSQSSKLEIILSTLSYACPEEFAEDRSLTNF